jgi:predicted enzyme related to lactoylglutathione lyase
MCGHGGPMRARCFHQLTKLQLQHRALHGALRKAGSIGQHAQAGFDRLPVLAGGATGKMEIDQECRGLLIMPDDIAHEHVKNVIIDGNASVKTRHHYVLPAIPIKGQRFSRHSAPWSWTPINCASYVRDMIKQIKFVSIPVEDQDRALDFYTEKLGFTIITDQPFDEKQRWIELRVPKAETRLVLFTTDEDKARVGTFMNISYTCDDLQKTYEDLKKRGVEFENPPKKEHWGNYAIFKDSEGNRFVIGD